MFRVLIFILSICTAIAQPYLAELAHTIDGDTLVLTNGQTIRLAYIDAPELKQEPYGHIASIHLTFLLYGKEIEVIPIAQDKYGRTIAQLFVQGECISMKMIQSGNALAYENFTKIEFQKENRKVFFEKPWEFRKKSSSRKD